MAKAYGIHWMTREGPACGRYQRRPNKAKQRLLATTVKRRVTCCHCHTHLKLAKVKIEQDATVAAIRCKRCGKHQARIDRPTGVYECCHCGFRGVRRVTAEPKLTMPLLNSPMPSESDRAFAAAVLECRGRVNIGSGTGAPYITVSGVGKAEVLNRFAAIIGLKRRALVSVCRGRMLGPPRGMYAYLAITGAEGVARVLRVTFPYLTKDTRSKFERITSHMKGATNG
jgi:hypothetical protein